MAFFTAEQAAALSRAAWLSELRFKSGTVYAWAGYTDLEIGGHTWIPTKGMVQIDGLGLSGEPTSKQVTMTVPGVGGDFLAAALAESGEADQQPLLIYLQTFDDAWQTVGGLIPLFYGLMQQPRVARSQAEDNKGSTQSVSIAAENAFYNRARPPNGRYTSKDQSKRTATPDTFFDFMPSLSNKTFVYPDY